LDISTETHGDPQDDAMIDRLRSLGAKRRADMLAALEQSYAQRKAAEVSLLIDSAVTSVTETESAFRNEDVQRYVVRALQRDVTAPPAGLDKADWAQVVGRVVDRQVTRELGKPSRYPTYRDQDGQIWRTTLVMQEAEKRFLADAAALGRQDAPVSPEAQVQAVAAFEAAARAKGWEVEPEKSAALKTLLGPGGLKVVDGVPGAGKSSMAQAFVEAVQQGGRKVFATAPTEKAASAIALDTGATGVQMDDLADMLKKGKIPSGSQIVLDEAGMAGSLRMQALVEGARRSGVGIAMLGDRQQLPPREAGEPFRLICGIPSVPIAQLGRTRRQKDPHDRAAVEALHAGDAGKAIRSFADRGQVKIKDDAVAAATKRYLKDRPGTASKAADLIVLAPDAEAARKINKAILAAEGRRPGDGFREGDRVIVGGDVTGRSDGKEVKLQAGTTATVVGTGAGVSLQIDGQGKETVSLSSREAGRLDHAFALGLRDAQGISVKNAIFAVTRPLDRAEALVGLSRHKEGVTMIADKKVYDSPAAMVPDFARRRDKLTVSDLQAQAVRRAAAMAR
jgi:ATP-dependent exoDNAse (exonuclease V) alpha subunit